MRSEKSWDEFVRFIEGRVNSTRRNYVPKQEEYKPLEDTFKMNGKWYLNVCPIHKRILSYHEFAVQHCFWCEPQYAPPGNVCYDNKNNRHFTKEEIDEKLSESRTRKNKNAQD